MLTTLGDRSADLQSLINAGDQVLSATAARNTALTADGQRAAAVPERSCARRWRRSTPRSGSRSPSLAALKPVAPLLTPALSELIALSGPAVKLLREAPGLLDDANRALPAITRFTKAFHPALDAILPAAQQLAPVIAFMGLYKRELTAAMANLARGPAGQSASATTAQPVGNTRPAWPSTCARSCCVNNESVYGQTVREPTNRHNAYFSPGELSNLANGLFASDCNNIHNKSQASDPEHERAVQGAARVPLGQSFAPTTPSSATTRTSAAAK